MYPKRVTCSFTHPLILMQCHINNVAAINTHSSTKCVLFASENTTIQGHSIAGKCEIVNIIVGSVPAVIPMQNVILATQVQLIKK